jgi:hypothetical protein
MVTWSCSILEYEAHELLKGLGYKVHILQRMNNKHSMPLCVVAFRPPGETRFVRIRKVTRRPVIMKDVEDGCYREIVLFRKMLARSQPDPGLHCEIWIFSPRTGFHCYEVLRDSITVIPTPTLKDDDMPPVFSKNLVPAGDSV